MLAKLFFLFVFPGILSFSEAGDELLAVTLVYRHGDRTPLSFYPNDPYKDPSFWPEPPGELTNIGKMQQFKLGKWLRNRYNNFLSSTYNVSEIYIRSSDNDRCLMSAASNLAGLYPPQGADIWNTELSWQPIPIHTVPENRDSVVEVASSCSVYNSLKLEAEKLPYFENIHEKYKDLFEYLTIQTGKNISLLDEASDLYDALLIEQIYNLTLPEWTNSVYSQLKEIGDIAPQILTYTPQLAKLFLGRLYKHVHSQFTHFRNENLKDSNQDGYKFKVFSAHDDQIFSILTTLKVANVTKIPYAALVAMELWRSEDDKEYVQLIYKPTENIANIEQMGNCDLKCNFNQFLEIIEPVVLTEEEFHDQCAKSDDSYFR